MESLGDKLRGLALAVGVHALAFALLFLGLAWTQAARPVSVLSAAHSRGSRAATARHRGALPLSGSWGISHGHASGAPAAIATVLTQCDLSELAVMASHLPRSLALSASRMRHVSRTKVP